ncbi:hypothetical protein M2336_001654 [Sphingobium sp. B1D7B]|uniref:hypothetical protein n=1 Tax=Sphingobium sp. B1D7B TaxID=2940578 RepID=UPI002224CB3A|nr:hypothetical protein [Sphingobium sp. B1D7B]MCW2405025.1 hypothetical protein [Sphingobium sp. B1D7B]
MITYQVTATGVGGSASATSSAVGPVIAAAAAPVISFNGTTFSNDNSDAGQWYRDGVAISGQTGATYTYVQANDAGRAITQVVGGQTSNAIVPTVTASATVYDFNQANGTKLSAYPGQPMTMLGGNTTEQDKYTCQSNRGNVATLANSFPQAMAVRNVGANHEVTFKIDGSPPPHIAACSDASNFMFTIVNDSGAGRWLVYSNIGGTEANRTNNGIQVPGSLNTGKLVTLAINNGKWQFRVDGLPYAIAPSFGGNSVQTDVWYDLPAGFTAGPYAGIKGAQWGSFTCDDLTLLPLDNAINIDTATVTELLDGSGNPYRVVRLVGRAAANALNAAEVILLNSAGNILSNWTARAGAPGSGTSFSPIDSQPIPYLPVDTAVRVVLRDATTKSTAASVTLTVLASPYDGLNHYGVNLFPVRMFRSDALSGGWRGTPEGDYDYVKVPYIGVDGVPTMYPPGDTGSWQYLLPIQPAGEVDVVRRYALTWEGGGPLTGSGSTAAVYISAFAGPSDTPVVVYSSSENRIELEMKGQTGGRNLVLRRSNFNSSSIAKNFQLADIGPATGSTSMQGAGAIVAADFLPAVATYLSGQKYNGVWRMLDISRTNSYNYCTSLDGLLHEWQTSLATGVTTATLTVGSGSSKITFTAQDPRVADNNGLSNVMLVAQRLPYLSRGTAGNNVRVKSVVGTGGSATITVGGTNNYDVLITQKLGGNTTGEIAALLNPATGVLTGTTNQIIALNESDVANSSASMPIFDWTNLSGGSDGSMAFAYKQVQETLKVCNDAGTRPWINIPWFAGSEWVAGFIAMVEAELTNPDCWPVLLHAHNEPWNYLFNSHWRMAEWAVWNGLDALPGFWEPTGYCYAALGHRFKDIFTQFKAAWGNDCRTVIDVQQGASGMVSGLRTIAGLDAVVDVYSTAPYVNAGSATASYFPDSSYNDAYFRYAVADVPSRWDSYASIKTTIELTGKRSAIYEIQQHDVLDNPGWSNPTMQAVYTARQLTDVRMEYLINLHFSEGRDRCSVGTVDDVAFFGAVGGVSQYGAWGMEQDYGTHNPKWKGYSDFIDNKPVAYPAPVGFGTSTTTATAGQSVFTVSGGYYPGQIIVQVQLGGSWSVLPSSAYTATNGTTVTLATALASGNVFQAIKFGAGVPYSGSFTSGGTVTVSVPALKHAVTAELWLVLDGVENSKVTNLGTLTAGSSVPFTFNSGHVGKVPNFRVKMWDVQGREMFATFGVDTTTKNTSAVT